MELGAGFVAPRGAVGAALHSGPESKQEKRASCTRGSHRLDPHHVGHTRVHQFLWGPAVSILSAIPRKWVCWQLCHKPQGWCEPTWGLQNMGRALRCSPGSRVRHTGWSCCVTSLCLAAWTWMPGSMSRSQIVSLRMRCPRLSSMTRSSGMPSSSHPRPMRRSWPG